jgi:hypothetical protein
MLLSLAKVGGYDYFKLLELDTPAILDMLEFNHIWQAMEQVASRQD